MPWIVKRKILVYIMCSYRKLLAAASIFFCFFFMCCGSLSYFTCGLFVFSWNINIELYIPGIYHTYVVLLLYVWVVSFVSVVTSLLVLFSFFFRVCFVSVFCIVRRIAVCRISEARRYLPFSHFLSRRFVFHLLSLHQARGILLLLQPFGFICYQVYGICTYYYVIYTGYVHRVCTSTYIYGIHYLYDGMALQGIFSSAWKRPGLLLLSSH